MREDAIVVRPLTAADRAAWEPLWQGYQAFYCISLPPEVSDGTFARMLDPAEPIHGLGAFVDGELAAIAHYIFHATTWSLAPRCYLNDLFTAEAHRGRGLARRLIEAVYEAARSAGADRVYWLTHKDNATARALYDRVAEDVGFVQYRKLLP
ncbi:GNAT family N-acetyltransferase [Chelatococcus composti]|jgi:GNAT superfamily N-acetyltransferase|uniref:GNAT superfamily N-acetyltransferase n=1 Tax=Chelatococcus composti TaxID=1743235 RepID=A0A841K575_9HYPH|nr:GNAT family N-acetyltransferase [Chelatococcus composti]MBB6166642.1 GNAT superfamily N-acetyltransferase [Chelatococcus composti]MBS7734431.1 GNAT family N-acetyltransferase [Chelatococcus composti]PZN38075.1 MAG: GNAT family N-acetyltransferase [Pseudomonadota bacterium]GGG26837.1 N-acetyltransferase [Chelatococcus composti]